jgi:hypothetical protein
MLAMLFATFDIGLWSSWVSLGAGVAVAFLVLGSTFMYGQWRRRLTVSSREEDLQWDKLLEMLQHRNRDRAATGLPPEPMTEEVLDELMARLPSLPDAKPVELPEDREFRVHGGIEKRESRRRWGNPTGVYLYVPPSADGVFGLVVNRSTGGIGIYSDQEFAPQTLLRVRAADGPSDIAAVRVEVRYCRKIGKGFLIGGQFRQDVPWNVRVWFG